MTQKNKTTSISFSSPVDLEAAKGDALPRFSIHAYNGGPIHVARFAHPLVLELASAKWEDTEQTYINRHHDQKRELGHSDEREINDSGIFLAGVFSHDNEDTNEILEAHRRGKKFKASIEANVKAQFYPKGRSVQVNGKTFQGPVYVARGSIITGVAILTRAADMQSNVRIAAMEKAMDPKLREYIEAAGFDPDNLTDQQVVHFQLQFGGVDLNEPEKKEKKEPEKEPGEEFRDMVAKQREIAAAEAERIADIQRICAEANNPTVALPDGGTVSLEAHAIKAPMTAKECKVEAKLFQLEQQSGGHIPAFHDATKYDTDAKVIEASMVINADGVSEDDVRKNKWYDEQTINLAMDDRFRGYRVSQLVYATMRAAGIYYPAGRLDDGYIAAAVKAHQKLQAAASGFSTLSLPGILSNVANKTLMAAYVRSASMVPFFCAQTNVMDFKPVYDYQLEGSGRLEQLGADGQIKHGELVESEYTSQLETHAKMLAFTRKHMINDDLGALTRVTSILGTMAYKAREFAAAQLLANSAMFTDGTTNGVENLITSNALSINGLTVSGQKFDAMNDQDGLPISIDGPRILAPSSQKVVTSQLQNQTEIRNTTGTLDDSPYTNNPHAGNFTAFNSQWLDNALASAVNDVADPNRSITWYRFADPAAAPAFKVLYLNGNSSPIIQSSETDFNTTGMQWRCIFDFNFGECDPRYAQKNVG